MGDLFTARLTLTPFTLELMKTMLENKDGLGQVLAIQVHEEWPRPDITEALSLFVGAMEGDPAQCVWGIWLVIHREDRTLLGEAGFHGPPDEAGMVEIGYSVLPGYREQGYATEATRAVINWAFSQPQVQRITAEVFPENLASIRIIEKLGMRLLRIEDDVLKWELCKGGKAP